MGYNRKRIDNGRRNNNNRIILLLLTIVLPIAFLLYILGILLVPDITLFWLRLPPLDIPLTGTAADLIGASLANGFRGMTVIAEVLKEFINWWLRTELPIFVLGILILFRKWQSTKFIVAILVTQVVIIIYLIFLIQNIQNWLR